MPTAELWGADEWHRPKSALQHTGSASASARANSEQGMRGVSLLQLPYTPHCGLGTGREEPLLPGSPFTGCSRWSSTRGTAHKVLGEAWQEQRRKLTSRATVEPGGHGAHGPESMEHPQTVGRAPAGAGILLTVSPSRQGVGRAPQSTAQTTMPMSTTMPVVSVGSQGGRVPAQLPALPSSAACVKHLFSQLSPALVPW